MQKCKIAEEKKETNGTSTVDMKTIAKWYEPKSAIFLKSRSSRTYVKSRYIHRINAIEL